MRTRFCLRVNLYVLKNRLMYIYYIYFCIWITRHVITRISTVEQIHMRQVAKKLWNIKRKKEYAKTVRMIS
jgi:hypothetical protein